MRLLVADYEFRKGVSLVRVVNHVLGKNDKLIIGTTHFDKSGTILGATSLLEVFGSASEIKKVLTYIKDYLD